MFLVCVFNIAEEMKVPVSQLQGLWTQRGKDVFSSASKMGFELPTAQAEDCANLEHTEKGWERAGNGIARAGGLHRAEKGRTRLSPSVWSSSDPESFVAVEECGNQEDWGNDAGED